MKKHYKPLLPFLYSAITSFPFTEYDFDAMTEYEILQALTYKVNECIGVINDIQGDIDTVVTNILNEWLADGTLEEIISETVLGYLKIFYVPEEFGAKGDGITDDTDAFDAACKAMAAGDIKILFIPAKTYVIGSTIAIPEGCSIIGTGRDSVIFYSENITTFGVGLTNAGNNVTIKNIRVEQARESDTITWGAQTGCIAFSTLDEKMAGKIASPSGTWTRKNTHTLRAENIYSENAPYVLQTETPTSGLYSITDVIVNNVYAPNSLISFMSKADNGFIKDITYNNIVAEYIRADQGGNNVINGKVSNFSCTGMMLAAPGLTAEHGYIDATNDVRYSYEYALNLKAGTKVTDLEIAGGAASLNYAITCTGFEEGATVMRDCKVYGFPGLIRAAKYQTTNVYYVYNCDFDWNNTAAEQHLHIQGYGENCKFRDDFHPSRPFYENITKSFPVQSASLTINASAVASPRMAEGFKSTGDKMHIKLHRQVPSNGKICTVAETFTPYFGAENSEVPVTLWKDDGTSFYTRAKFNDSGELIIDAGGETLTNYDYLVIDGDIALNPWIWE